MAETTRHDAWSAGDSYDAYMGRWSRQIAPRFLDWLALPAGLDWYEVGCGTGALSAAILAKASPKSLTAIDPSEGFIATARRNIGDPRVRFATGDAQALAAETDSADALVCGLVLNFIPDKAKALAEMRRVARPGGTVAFYVWDYAGGGIEFMRAFWREAAILDPAARDLTEDRRFPFATAEGLGAIAREAGLSSVSSTALEAPSVFRDFDDYWRPFTLGAGPAPGYCASLPPDAREKLRARLDAALPRMPDGSIRLNTRAWGVRGTA